MPSLSRFLTLGALVLAACGDADAVETDSPTQRRPRQHSRAASPPGPAAPDPTTSPGSGLVQPAQVSRSGGWQHYGAGFTLPADRAITCEALLADLDARVDHSVRVRGRIAEVCQERGCWMLITPLDPAAADRALRVTMKDDAFSVDRQAAGREAEVEGVLVHTPPATEGAVPDAPGAGEAGSVPTGPDLASGYELVASTVRIRN